MGQAMGGGRWQDGAIGTAALAWPPCKAKTEDWSAACVATYFHTHQTHTTAPAEEAHQPLHSHCSQAENSWRSRRMSDAACWRSSDPSGGSMAGSGWIFSRICRRRGWVRWLVWLRLEMDLLQNLPCQYPQPCSHPGFQSQGPTQL